MDAYILSELIEEEHLEAFQAFYAGLRNKQAIFYSFFTAGLLHWVWHSARLAPADANLVLLGSALDPEEQDWLRRLGRPFHHIALDVDDKTVWEFLFRTNRHDFGWLDIDCLVLNPALFGEMARIEPDVLANCVFSFRGRDCLDVPLTYFIFLNAGVIRSVTARVPVSPCTYSYRRSRAARRGAYAFARVLTPELIALLAKVLPRGSDGRPLFLSEDSYYDTLQVYQAAAQALGFRLHKVRPIGWEAASDELVHVGKASYYRTRWDDPDSPEKRHSYALLLQTEYLLLVGIRDQMPARYGQLLEELSNELAILGIPAEPRRIRETLQAMGSGAGLGAGALARVFDMVSPRSSTETSTR